MIKMYDLIIIGAGPSGLTAALYAHVYKLKTLLISNFIGGAIISADHVYNYLGLSEMSGFDFIQKVKEQIAETGIDVKQEEVRTISKSKNMFTVNQKYESKAVILALGTQRKKLNIKGEQEFAGRGISYCAECDAGTAKQKTVGVVGCGEHALKGANILSKFAKKVYLFCDKKITAKPHWVSEAKKAKNIIFTKSAVSEISGDKFLKFVVADGKKFKLDILFVEIGMTPSSVLANSLGVKVDKNNYVIVDDCNKTNIPFVYAAGDITTKCKLKQVITAAAEGAVAARSAFEDLKK